MEMEEKERAVEEAGMVKGRLTELEEEMRNMFIIKIKEHLTSFTAES